MTRVDSKLAAIALVALFAVTPAMAQEKLERQKVHIGVGGKTALYYLPLTITERLGYFKEQGLDVEISDFQGGSKSMQALVGGSVDVVAGAYEHTITIQAKGQEVQAFTALDATLGMPSASPGRRQRATSRPGI